jgi:hypothetical protein
MENCTVDEIKEGTYSRHADYYSAQTFSLLRLLLINQAYGTLKVSSSELSPRLKIMAPVRENKNV